MKDCAGAMEPLNRAIELDPRSAWAHHMRGMANTRLREFDAALADYTRALELQPTRVGTYRARGFLRVTREEHALAVEDFDRVLDLKPYWAATYSGRASAHDVLGNAAQALRDARIAQLLNPNLGVADEIVARLGTVPAAGEAPPAPYAAPDTDRTFTYIEVVTDVTKEVDPMEAAIFDLVNWFSAETKPLPDSRRLVARRVVGTTDGVTTVTASVPTSSSGRSEDVPYMRGIWPVRLAMGEGAPTFELGYDTQALDTLWPLAAGNSAAGGGAMNLVCPDEPTPMSAMLQCAAGDRVPMGKLEWTASVDRYETVLVPAGPIGAYVIVYTEKTSMQMFGQEMVREATTTWWYSPAHRCWLRRTSENQGKVHIVEAMSIE